MHTKRSEQRQKRERCMRGANLDERNREARSGAVHVSVQREVRACPRSQGRARVPLCTRVARKARPKSAHVRASIDVPGAGAPASGAQDRHARVEALTRGEACANRAGSGASRQPDNNPRLAEARQASRRPRMRVRPSGPTRAGRKAASARKSKHAREGLTMGSVLATQRRMSG